MTSMASPSPEPSHERASDKTRSTWRALLGGSVVLALVVLGACGGDKQQSTKKICDPGQRVNCTCSDGIGKGTHVCNDEGDGFSACVTDNGGECKGTVGSGDDDDIGDDDDDIGRDSGTNTKEPIEACPGKVTAVGASSEVTIQGDTTDASDDAKGVNACSVGSQGPDHVYHLKPTDTGSLAISVTGEKPFDPVLYVRRDCTEEDDQLKCATTTGPGGTEQFSMNVVAGKDYYLFVDGSSGSSGKYTLKMKLTAGPFCGDGVVRENEACDDGEIKIDDDGCSNDCQKPNGDPPSGNGCPGHPVEIWPGRTVTATGSTNPYGNAWVNTGTSCAVSDNAVNAAQDHVYQVTARQTGILKVNLTPEASANLMLVARRTCADPKSQGTNTLQTKWCSNDGTAGGAEALAFPVTNGTKYYVAVDGALNAKGKYSITFSITPL